MEIIPHSSLGPLGLDQPAPPFAFRPELLCEKRGALAASARMRIKLLSPGGAAGEEHLGQSQGELIELADPVCWPLELVQNIGVQHVVERSNLHLRLYYATAFCGGRCRSIERFRLFLAGRGDEHGIWWKIKD